MVHTRTMVDIREENLKCHHVMFIKDVVTSSFDPHQNTFTTKSTRLTYRHARLNGIIVKQKQARLKLNHDSFETHIWIDDGTSVIRAILSPTIMNRKDAEFIAVSCCITVFGKLEQRFNKKRQQQEIMVRCGGFKIETDSTGEIYHWLKALLDRPKEMPKVIVEDGEATSHLSNVKDSSRECDKENQPFQQQHLPHNMFYSLSSEPSPNRLYNPDRFMQEEEIADINEKNASYLWSPDHTFATSTPLRPSTAAFTAPQPSPLRQTQPPAIPVTSQEEDEEDLFGSFSGLDGLDLDALEADVLQQRASETTVGASTTLSDSNKSNKRKFSLSMDNDL